MVVCGSARTAIVDIVVVVGLSCTSTSMMLGIGIGQVDLNEAVKLGSKNDATTV